MGALLFFEFFFQIYFTNLCRTNLSRKILEYNISFPTLCRRREKLDYNISVPNLCRKAKGKGTGLKYLLCRKKEEKKKRSSVAVKAAQPATGSWLLLQWPAMRPPSGFPCGPVG